MNPKTLKIDHLNFRKKLKPIANKRLAMDYKKCCTNKLMNTFFKRKPAIFQLFQQLSFRRVSSHSLHNINSNTLTLTCFYKDISLRSKPEITSYLLLEASKNRRHLAAMGT
jgi:hypothetical protein